MTGGKETGTGFFSEREPGPRFVNLYMGSRREKLDFNRKAIEGFLKLTAINKTVTLAEGLSGTNFNGKGNIRYRQAKPVFDGYRVEIDELSILQDLPKLEEHKFDKRFSSEFNKHFRSSLRAILIKEKLTGVENFRDKVAASLLPPVIMSVVRLADGLDREDVPIIIVTSLMGNMLFNLNLRYDLNFPLGRKSLSSNYEYLMPAVEVDRVVAGFVYLDTYGRDLVRAKS